MLAPRRVHDNPMTTKRKNHRPRLLSSTRPSMAKPTPSLSSRKTRSLVREHHTLRKQLSNALVRNDDVTATTLKTQIEAAGGLSRYQDASILGQSGERGGDSSKVLMEWLSEASISRSTIKTTGRLRMLEVGALSPENACSRSEMFDMKRIDLHSRHAAIKEEDFMLRPLPVKLEEEGFDIVSLSLVVNFVGDAVGRGEMLKRVSSFLNPPRVDETRSFFPSLFLVLPAPCVTNSRYLDEDLLVEIMQALGYVQVKRKISAKLVYYLWRLEESKGEHAIGFKRREVRSGKSRNNFAIILN